MHGSWVSNCSLIPGSSSIFELRHWVVEWLGSSVGWSMASHLPGCSPPLRHYLFFPTFFHVSHAPSPPNMPVWYSLQLYPWQFSLKYSKWGLKCSPESFTPLPPTSNAVFVNSKYFYLCVTLEHKHLAHFYSLHCVWANKSTKNCLSRHLMSVCLIWITCVQWFMDLWGSGHVQV